MAFLWRSTLDAFIDTKFEPSGKVNGNDRILSASINIGLHI